MFNAPNKTHCLDKMTVEQFDREDKSNDKINAMIFIKSLKITITVSEKILTKYNSLGVKVKSIVADEQIKCLLFFKEHSTIIAGDQMGNIRVLRLKDLQEIKKKLPLNNGRYYLIIGKLIDTIIQLKGYRKRNDIFAMAGHDMKIIIFDYDGNILKIIHEGTKNYIKKLEYCQSLNCLLYIAKHEAFDKNYTVGHALKIYDLNEKDKPRNPLILQKFNEVLFMKKIYILGIEMIITSTKENLKYKEEDKFNYFTDNSIIIKSEQENPKQKTEEVKLKDERTLRQKAEDAKKNYKGRKENINFFHLKSLVKNKYSPILSIATEIQKITCAAVIKDLGNNYIAFSGDKIFIEIYKITMNNYMVFKEETVLRLNMNFEKIRKHCNLPFFCYLSTFDKFTLAVANELTTYNGKFNFFEYNEKKREFETILSNTQINQQNVEEEQKKLKEYKENKEGNDLKS